MMLLLPRNLSLFPVPQHSATHTALSRATQLAAPPGPQAPPPRQTQTRLQSRGHPSRDPDGGDRSGLGWGTGSSLLFLFPAPRGLVSLFQVPDDR